jgi:hypothetical protein
MENFKKTFAIVLHHFDNELNRLKIIDIAFCLEPFADKLEELNNLFTNEESAIVRTTIIHDYNGLKSKDEDFCPRLS